VSWNLITSEWRLKLLALGLAALMLGAVAFSQNPPTYKDLTVPIVYPNIPSDIQIVAINPPVTARVRVTALADVLQTVTPLSVAATIDLTKVSAGGDQHVNLNVKSVDSRVKVQNPVVPYVLNIDKRVPLKLDVHVRTPRVTPGWAVSTSNTYAVCPGAPAGTACQATFTGPASYEANLAAYVDYTSPVEQNRSDVPNQPVYLEQGNSGQRFDLGRSTVPQMTLDPLNVTVHVEATTTTSYRQVTLIDAPYTRPPAQGYRVTNVTVTPITIVISGKPDALARITTITLPQIDLGGRTSDYTATVQIPYPDGTDGQVKTAKVTYSIAANPNATP
jgi:YbbR domain-containing protein